MKKKCLDPCTRSDAQGRTEPVTCCDIAFNNEIIPGMNWECSGTAWNRYFVNRDIGNYTGVEHDDICKDIGVMIFQEKNWKGMDGITPIKN